MIAVKWLEKAERCLASARLLLVSGDYASACNRAYYAMFNAARATLIAVGQERLSAAKTHAGVISAFGEHVVSAGLADKSISRLLGKEAHRRLVADYQGTDLDEFEAVDAIADAQTFIDSVASMIRASA